MKSGILMFLFLLARPSLAQLPVDLHQAFLDMRHDGVIMNISAHPDDEDGATLAYYRMKYGVRTYSVFFTRGEGGQNEKGPELYEELGVLRTEETQEAARIQGTEAYFLNLSDFGYSKTATETFEKWGGTREVLRRLVYIIRRLKPDIMFTHHNTVDGHGHHQAVGITTIAAFDAAADPTFFPEQLKDPGVDLWQPRKLLFRNFGRTDQTADVVNSIDEIEPIREASYMDIASRALRMHKTQGMDRADLRRFTRGISLYKLMRANSPYDRDSTTFFGGIDFWVDPALAPLQSIRKQLDRVSPDTSLDHLLPALSRVLGRVDSLAATVNFGATGGRILSHWRENIEHLAARLCDVQMSFVLSDSVLVARQKVRGTLDVTASCSMSSVRQKFAVPEGWVVNEAIDSAPKGTLRHFSRDFEIVVGESPVFTLPATEAIYNPIEIQQDVVVHVAYLLNGYRFTASVRPRFDVAAVQTLKVVPKITWAGAGSRQRDRTFEYRVKNFRPHKIAGKVSVELPAGWRGETSAYVIGKEDEEAGGKIVVSPPSNVSDGSYTLRFKTEYAASEVTVRVFDVQVPQQLQVGIIKSYDNTLETVAGELGVRYTLLDSTDLMHGNLSRYSTIVVDIRSYLVREDLKSQNRRLLDYVHDGGNLVVMYQRDQEWKPEYAPYPFQVSRKRVTVEEAPVTILEPFHALMNKPNAITEDAWRGWTQERGVYFPSDVAPEYTRILSSSDPVESPLTTGYIVAPYGSGLYIYTSYVWYRQLKEANPGAYRCFANMISYPSFR